jgi:hypothetical protein
MIIPDLLWTQMITVLLGTKWSEGKFLVTKFEFWREFGKSLEGRCHEVDFTPNLKLLVTIGISSDWFCHELYT